MILKRLRVANLRGFWHETEFQFQPGMNLLVGANGVGKSTVLDALRTVISKMLRDVSVYSGKPLHFSADDVTAGRDFLSISLTCDIDGSGYTYIVNKQVDRYGEYTDGKGNHRLEGHDRPDISQWEQRPKESPGGHSKQHLVVYFSPRRSLASDESPRTHREGAAVAFHEALLYRELRLQEYAEWILTRQRLAADGLEKASTQLQSLNRAVCRFLDSCSDLRVQTEERRPRLLVFKGNYEFTAQQLSDGERGLLALVMDLTRRLSYANPEAEDPASDGQAIVLIDELDLHLHPKWQRTIAKRLTDTFPKCQFIATTHSPQIIGEISPQCISVIDANGVWNPSQSYGMDTNWVLRVLMDAEERDPEIAERLTRVFRLIQDSKLAEAEAAIEKLKGDIGGVSEDIQRATGIVERVRLMGR